MTGTSHSHARERREEPRQSREPWAQLGRYVRDAAGRVIIRAKSPADSRRVVACVNALTGVPTETIEGWNIQVTGGAGVGPDPDLAAIPQDAVEAIQEFVGDDERRVGQRRRADRRHAGTEIAADAADAVGGDEQ